MTEKQRTRIGSRQWRIWIDPQSVVWYRQHPFRNPTKKNADYSGLSGWVTKKYYHVQRRRRFIGGTWDEAVERFEEHGSYQRLQSLWASLPDYQESAWYQEVLEDIASRGGHTHKGHRVTSESEAQELFEGSLIPMLYSFRDEGYREQEGEEVPRAMIGRGGRLVKISIGRHRLAAAQITGSPGAFPLRIVAIHRDVLKEQRRGGARSRRQAIERCLEQVQEACAPGGESR